MSRRAALAVSLLVLLLAMAVLWSLRPLTAPPVMDPGLILPLGLPG